MVPPNEQNFFVATQLVFSLAKFVGVDLSFTWNGPHRVLRKFCVLFCSVLSVLFCVVLIITQCAILKGVFFNLFSIF